MLKVPMNKALCPLSLNNAEDIYVNTSNGLYLNSTYFPEEIITLVLSYVEARNILKCRLVCRKWNSVIKSLALWSIIYERIYNCKAKKLPWYLYFCLFSTNYFNSNLLKNGNGQYGLKHWKLKIWDGDDYVEQVPFCCNPLPENVPEFNNHKSCFTTSYFSGFKSQLIPLDGSRLFQYILKMYKPSIYLSEWTTGRNDCSCVYKLQCSFLGNHCTNINTTKPFVSYYKPQWQEGKWVKMEILIADYPDNITYLKFENEGCNAQSWKRHFGCKMAGGVVKFLFDTIEPLDEINSFNQKEHMVKFFSNGLPQDEVIDYFQCDYIWNDHSEESYYFMP